MLFIPIYIVYLPSRNKQRCLEDKRCRNFAEPFLYFFKLLSCLGPLTFKLRKSERIFPSTNIHLLIADAILSPTFCNKLSYQDHCICYSFTQMSVMSFKLLTREGLSLVYDVRQLLIKIRRNFFYNVCLYTRTVTQDACQ